MIAVTCEMVVWLLGVGACEEPVSAQAAIEAHFPRSEWQNAKRIMWCESLGDPTAVGDGGRSVGLFQIQPRWWSNLKPQGSWFDASVNAEWAYRIWRSNGWYPWTCRYRL